VDTSGLGSVFLNLDVAYTYNGMTISQAMYNSFHDAIQGLYTNNYTSPLGERNGLRQTYEFGLYSYCAFVNSSAGTCSNHTSHTVFEPYAAISSDMLQNYTQFADGLFVGTTSFANSSYLGDNARVAYYFILLGTIFAAIALFT
jgi:hypothetical protein